MKKLLRNIIICFIVVGTVNHTYSLTKEEVKSKARVCGVWSGLIAGVGTCCLMKNSSRAKRISMSSAIGLGVMALVNYAVYETILGDLPDTALQGAKDIFDECRNHEVIVFDAASKEVFCKFVFDRVNSFVYADGILSVISKKLSGAFKLAEFVKAKSIGRDGDGRLFNESSRLIEQINILIEDVNKKRIFIVDEVAFEKVNEEYDLLGEEFNVISSSPLIVWALESPQAVMDHAELYHTSKWPLVYIQRDLKEIQQKLKWIIRKLNRCIKDYSSISICSATLENCKLLLEDANERLSLVEDSIGVLAINNTYLTQVRMQQEYK